MNTKSKSASRSVLSLAAFTTLIAAVTLAFADVPQSSTPVTFKKGEPAISVTPPPLVRLAEAPARNTGTKSTQKPLQGTLNLNIATGTELTKLPGIGPKKAKLIVQWRKKNGSFRRIVDLRRVKGFGAKTVKKLLPYLAVKGKNTLQ